MKTYKLKQPVKNPQPIGYWLFVIGLSAFMLWMVLINPLLNWPFDRPGEVSRLEYGLLTGGAIIAAVLAVIPVIRESSRFEYTLALLMANRHYVTHEEWMKLSNEHESKMVRGNSPEIQSKLQDLVDSHKGKDLRVKEYGLKPQYAEDLECCGEK